VSGPDVFDLLVVCVCDEVGGLPLLQRKTPETPQRRGRNWAGLKLTLRAGLHSHLHMLETANRLDNLRLIARFLNYTIATLTIASVNI
jgi:hypothetical protein